MMGTQVYEKTPGTNESRVFKLIATDDKGNELAVNLFLIEGYAGIEELDDWRR